MKTIGREKLLLMRKERVFGMVNYETRGIVRTNICYVIGDNVMDMIRFSLKIQTKHYQKKRYHAVGPFLNHLEGYANENSS